MAANSLRPQIVQVMAAHRERPLTTREIHQHVAASGVEGFDPKAKRDRNLVNREISDLAGMSPESHGKPTPRPLHLQGVGGARTTRSVWVLTEEFRPPQRDLDEPRDGNEAGPDGGEPRDESRDGTEENGG